MIKKNNNNYNYLNLGYVSYSPSIYFKRLEYFINEKNLNFEKIFIFVDHSDIQDEGIFYREDKRGNIVRKWLSDDEVKWKNNKHKIKNYLKQNSFIFKLFENINSPKMSAMAQKCILDGHDKINLLFPVERDFKNYLDKERFGYGYIENIQYESWVNDGINKIYKYLKNIIELSKQNNFKTYIVYYPSALEVLENINYKQSKHYTMLKNFSDKNKITLIDAADNFFANINGNKNYIDNFIKCDAHWNKNGHKNITNSVIEYIND